MNNFIENKQNSKAQEKINKSRLKLISSKTASASPPTSCTMFLPHRSNCCVVHRGRLHHEKIAEGNEEAFREGS